MTLKTVGSDNGRQWSVTNGKPESRGPRWPQFTALGVSELWPRGKDTRQNLQDPPVEETVGTLVRLRQLKVTRYVLERRRVHGGGTRRLRGHPTE